MRRIFTIIAAILGTFTLNAQNITNSPEPALSPTMGKADSVIEVWPDGAPNSNGITGQMKNKNGASLSNISEALLHVYLPKNPNGLCIIMCPGGGYSVESIFNEGSYMAQWMNRIGVTYCVLQYRLPNNGHYEVPLSDAEEAVRIARKHAEEWHIGKVGIMGASAGGHLASTLATHYHSADCRPDFQILMYPVITMDSSYTHKGSRTQLLGNDPSKEIVDMFSNEKHVNAETPPAFIILASDDKTVPPANSLNYYSALIANKVKAAMFIYPSGGHGFGFKDSFPFKREWTGELERWLRDLE
ncbi:MAG: alpha/beta hydrolase [Bacteroidales bacterium]|jgi:acetyl esterase/lipase|nr:alpha/beta hydrolase [Bacteroidales bacterium]MCI2146235.1 alpha/beta hydrolase [Bacteroidales bacterium]